MDDFFSVDLFNENISSLKETSKDKQKESISYMTDSDYEVVNFDGVKSDYIRGLCISETPCSNDAVCVLDDKDTIVFIEFNCNRLLKITVAPIDNSAIIPIKISILKIFVKNAIRYDNSFNNVLWFCTITLSFSL